MGWLIALGVLLFINLLPLGAHIVYDENGVVLKMVLGHVQIPLLPQKEKLPKQGEISGEDRKPEKEDSAEQKRKKAEKKQAAAEKKLRKKKKPKDPKPLGAVIDTFMPLVKLGLKAIADIRWLPTIRKLKMRITYGGADAGTAAMNYGKAWGIIGAGMAMLTRNLRIRKYDVQPELDYSCEKVRISADATVFLTLGRLMCYLIRYGVGALKILIRINKQEKKEKKEKAVQKNESSSS